MIRIVAVASLLLMSGLANAASVSVNIPITVTPALSGSPGVTLSVSPSTIAPGGSSLVSWSSPDATTCKGFGGFSTGDATSGSVAVSPITTTTYGLSCSNASSVSSTVSTLTVSLVNVVNANGNCSGAHAGTSSDPFPFSCIVQAINSLPAVGGTVMVGDGIWQTSTVYNINRGNFNLVGNGLNAVISLTGSNYININSSSNVRISNLTIDGSLYTEGYFNAVHFSNMQNSSLTNCKVISLQNSALAAILFEGGSNNSAIGNSFIPNTTDGGGGSQLQLNPLGGTPNAGFLVQSNSFDSIGLLIIGLNTALINGNNFNNKTLGNTVAIQVAPALAPSGAITSDGITVDANTLDGGVGSPNGVFLSEISQDPGSIGAIQNLTFSNNTLKGTGATLALQTYDESCLNTCLLATTLNSKIFNNTLNSFWTGSLISIRGGTNGKVDGVIVQGNVLTGAAGAPNQILQDAHTYNTTIIGNSL
jgi:hypothetical protein